MTRFPQFIKVEKPVVISIFANSDPQRKLETSIEEQLLANSLGSCTHVQYVSLSNATVDDVIDTFNKYKNQVGIFHFGGHANETHLFLEDTPARASGVVRLIREHGSLPLVFLNGCSTKGQVALLLEAGVAAVIATEVEIADDVAIRFADRFYRTLSMDFSVEKAFNDAKNDMEIRGETEEIKLHTGDRSVLKIELAEFANFINRKRLLLPYARWLEQQHSTIPMIGLNRTDKIELDQVFISLRSEISKAYEIYQTQRQLEEALEELEQSWSDREMSELEKQQEKSRLLGRTAIMPTIEERDILWKKKEKKSTNLTVIEVLRDQDKLVILGDPGTGKTTLARWIALMFARAIIAGNHAHAASEEFEDVDGRNPMAVGPIRLPILIRVADFAEAAAKDPAMTIERFLGHQNWEGYPTFPQDAGIYAGQRIDPNALQNLMLDYMEKGEAVLILDGLDEISEELGRKRIVMAIEELIQTVLDKPEVNGLAQRNKLLITSRIAGYHLGPIRNEKLFHVTIQPMDRLTIERFCRTWISAVHLGENRDRKEHQVEFEAYESSRRLISLIFDPKRPGIQDLAGNPLLLTQLCRIFYLDNQRLPETRIDLYDRAVDNFLQVWEGRFRSKKDSFDTYKQKVMLILEDIADYIHENYPTGLILSREVEILTERSLEEYYRANPHVPRTQSLEVEQKAFLKTIREEVGVLAARGEELYGFLHLTFEEYFAARKLLRDREKISETIIGKAYQPRWREPLLLAISHLNNIVPLKQERNSVLKALLEKQDTMGNIVPRSANLIALAFPEMRYRLDGSFIQDVVLKLLNAYVGTDHLEDGEILRANVEETFVALTRSDEIWQTVVETFILVFRSDQFDSRFKNGVAHLIQKCEWHGDLPPEVFIAARSYDLAIWEWPIHRVLQKLASTQPEKLNHPSLALRTYLKEYPDAIQFIRRDSGWIKLLLLLYGGVIESRQDSKTSYDFSPDGIIEDSFLTEKIIHLIENRQSPDGLKEFCADHWHDERLPIPDRIDCVLVLLALDENALTRTGMFATMSDTLNHALIDRLDRLKAGFQAAVNATARGVDNEFMKSIVENADSAHIYHLLLQLLQLGVTFGERTPNPILWMESVPDEIQSRMLAEYWAVAFVSNDDTEYNLAVSLDTVGVQIEGMGPQKIAESFAKINDTVNLPPFDRWRVERIPFEPKDQYDMLEQALSNLAKLNPEFDLLKYWALKQILPLLEMYPDLKTSGITSILWSMKSVHYFQRIVNLAFPNNKASENPHYEYYRLIIAKNRQFHLAFPILGTYLKIDPFNHRLDDLHTARPDKQLREIFEMLSLEIRISAGQTEDNDVFAALLSSAVDYIERIDKPEIQTKGYLQLAIFHQEPIRRSLIQRSLETAKLIEDPFILGQTLREIRPWILSDAELIARFMQGKNRLTHPFHRAILENRSYPFFLGFTDVHQKTAALGILGVGAIIRDGTQLFSFPSDIAGLWECLLDPNTQHIDDIVNQLRERGRSERHRVTTLTALALSRLRQNGRQDLMLKLITSVEHPVPEAITLVSSWLEDLDPKIKALASLLLLEAGILNARSFPGLEAILFGGIFGHQDQLRNRVNWALYNQDFSATMIGADGLKLMEKAIMNNADSVPYLTKALSWAYEHITFDSPEIIEHFLVAAQGGGRDAKVASHILRNIHRIKGAETIQAYLNGFQTVDLRVQKCLLFSAIRVLWNWQKSLLEDHDYREDIRLCLRKAAQSDDTDVRNFALDAMGYLPHLMDDDRRVLRTQIIHGAPRNQYLALIALGRAAFDEEEGFLRSFLHHDDSKLRLAASEAYVRNIMILNGASADTLPMIEERLGSETSLILNALLHATKDFWWGNYSRNCFKILGDFFERHEHEYQVFLERVVPILSDKRIEDPDFNHENSTAWMDRMVHMDALAAGAERLPATFSRQARNTPGFDKMLQHVMLKSKIFTDRLNAITCISHMRRMSQGSIDSFCAALKDVAEVQDAAINSAHRIWETDSRFLQAISRQMDQETLSAKYAMLKMLIAIGTYHKTEPAIRQQILDILISKMNDENYHDDVYIFIKKIGHFQKSDGSEGISDLGPAIQHVGLLNREIYRGILEITGLRAIAET